MPNPRLLPADEQEQIEDLIISFDNPSCGYGLDIQAQIALRHLLEVIDNTEDALKAKGEQVGRWKYLLITSGPGNLRLNVNACYNSPGEE